MREDQLLVCQKQGTYVVLSFDAGGLKEKDGLYTSLAGNEGAGMGEEL